jgi:hypothetical protein
MKIYIVVEDFDSGPGVASLNICNIFLTEERANEKRDELQKDYDYFYGQEYRKTDEYKLYHNMFRVEGWDVEQ